MPGTAIASIFHRMAGVLLILVLPFILYLLQLSLQSESSFSNLKEAIANNFYYKALILLTVTAFWYHLMAGVRHIIMDFGFGESKCSARFSAYLIIALGIIFPIIVGMWLW